MDGAVSLGNTDWVGLPLDAMLDKLDKPIMLADADYVIRFVNKCASAMFRRVQRDIRKDLPDFSSEKVVGGSMDLFHRNPKVQKAILSRMGEEHRGGFKIGGVYLSFRATPCKTPDGTLTGVIVEWADDTDLRRAKEQVNLLMKGVATVSQAHTHGMVSERISLSGLEGDYKDVASGVNNMLEDHLSVQRQIIDAAERFSNGNFSTEMPRLEGERASVNRVMDLIQSNMNTIVQEISDLSNSIVEGKLDRSVHFGEHQGVFREILQSFDRAYGQLNNLFGSMCDNFGSISLVTEVITKAANEMTVSASTQSAAVEEISASAEETDQMVKSNSEASRTATKLFAGTARLAEDGLDKVERMVHAVDGIRLSSEQISKIIKVIEEIAFQTNLLALNAAVEAARAGEHGRGFAVVAQEVRNLAGRSAKAAQETGGLIEEAGNRVKAGVTAAADTQDAFEAISNDIMKVSNLIDGIAQASEEQSRGVSQINQAISDLSANAAKTHDQAEELNDAADNLGTASDQVQEKLSHIVLRPGAKRGAASAASAVPSLDAIPEALRSQIMAMVAAQRS